MPKDFDITDQTVEPMLAVLDYVNYKEKRMYLV